MWAVILKKKQTQINKTKKRHLYDVWESILHYIKKYSYIWFFEHLHFFLFCPVLLFILIHKRLYTCTDKASQCCLFSITYSVNLLYKWINSSKTKINLNFNWEFVVQIKCCLKQVCFIQSVCSVQVELKVNAKLKGQFTIWARCWNKRNLYVSAISLLNIL